jgi:hypothetical protein
LIYKYFGGKKDLPLATIMRILDVFRDQLAADGRTQIKELEIATAALPRAVIEAGTAHGVFPDIHVDLKHWYFGPSHTVDEYIVLQTRHVPNSLVAEGRRAEYAQLLGGGS